MHGVSPFSLVQYQRTEPKVEEKKESIITKVRDHVRSGAWADLPCTLYASFLRTALFFCFIFYRPDLFSFHVCCSDFRSVYFQFYSIVSFVCSDQSGSEIWWLIDSAPDF